jgi:hypothetical protein
VTGTIITGAHLTGIILSNPTIQNPATIAANGTVSNTGTALLGESRTAWIIANFGTIDGSGTFSAGINLQFGGEITNGSSASTKALVEGVKDGVYLGGTAASSVTNYGTIEGSGTSGFGIFLQSGGTITNGSSASTKTLIEGVGGVSLSGTTAGGTVTNFGTIKATTGRGIIFNADGTVSNLGTIESNGTAAAAIRFSATGSVTNGSKSVTTALIEGGQTGVLTVGIGTITNYGTITAATDSSIVFRASGKVSNFGTIENKVALLNGGLHADGIVLAGGGTLTNGTARATKALVTAIEGGIYIGGINGVPKAGATGTIINYGTISSTGLGTIGQTAIVLVSGGTVVNHGLIESAARSGISFRYQAGTVTNYGTIKAATDKSGVVLDAGGTVTNHGVIAGASYGIYFGTTASAGHVTNSGTITGKVGFDVGATDIAGNALTNSGRIVGTGGTAVAFGGGNDVLAVEKGAVFTGAVLGGGGTDKIVQGSAGTLNVTGFSGFETIVLFSGGIDTLTLKSANFAGVTGQTITITDGGKGNTVSAAGVAAADHIVVHAGAGIDTLTGGLGNDVFYADGKTTMTGAAGANEFVFKRAGSNTIKDFHVSAKNELVFSNADFNLGLTGGTAAPKKLTPAQAAKLFVANGTGKFTNTSQRLAYDTSNGELFASSTGSAGTEHLVTTLSDDAKIGTSQLFFVS